MISSTCHAWVGAVLHLVFAFGEMVPLQGGVPFILGRVLEKNKHLDITGDQLQLVKTIVMNAGAYNLIVGLGFLWAANPLGMDGRIDAGMGQALQAFFFAAAIWVGIVGLSLSRWTAIQIAVGVVGLALLRV